MDAIILLSKVPCFLPGFAAEMEASRIDKNITTGCDK